MIRCWFSLNRPIQQKGNVVSGDPRELMGRKRDDLREIRHASEII